ncbi:adenosylcobinamide-GDP ribazoletransferase [Pseudorhizobium endolithicum]|uniref:Adenosylcobinamide-GDP ribazoletransferase n=1 Tax=Pseudorhizobium endolithicum TaxID=1191678 RepID=A0ABM8PSC3_9HYPH|nr:adenosylcobinamide-GDP ribazoletransferase [Pseudorhizobium endolithicum]
MPARFFEGHDGSVSRAVRAFPAAGVLIAAGPALVLALLLQMDADPLLPVVVALTVLTILTGALHEDGLADAADGFGGGRDREHALSIMKDSRAGSYGVIALILSLALRTAALAALAEGKAALPALGLMAAAAISRGLMVWHWAALPSARPNGVAVAAGRPAAASRTFALTSAALLALLLLLPAVSPVPVLLAGALAALAALGVTRLATRKIGGHTGDTIGATQQASEIVFLASLALIA